MRHGSMGIVIKYAQYFTALVAVRYTLYTPHRAEPEGRAIPLPTPVPLTPATPRRATNPDPARTFYLGLVFRSGRHDDERG